MSRILHSNVSRLISLPVIFLIGCTTPKAPAPEAVPEPPDAPEVVAAESLFENGRLQDAVVACADIERKNPTARGLHGLEAKIRTKLAEERSAAALAKSSQTSKLSSADAERFNSLPSSYRQVRHVMGENAPLRTAPSAMQKVLAKPISAHLVNADINAIIAQIGQSQNVNIIADSDISPKTLTIHAENTPLLEILEYIGRNLNVNFSIGSNLIWVTPKEEETTGVPMETRVYRLRKGMLGAELGRSPHGVSIYKGPQERGGSRSNTPQKEDDAEPKEGKVGLLDSIKRFVPQPDGSDFLFNDKAHALIVKNTRENLALVEDLISAMDIRPVQVLIEARFVTTTVTDLSKLGVDWLFDNRGETRFENGSLSTSDPWARGKTTVENARRDVLSASLSSVDAAAKTGGANLAYQFLLGDTALKVVLNALESNGDSQTIVVPRVTTLNNREARFRVGEDRNYYEEVDANITTSGSSYSGGESRDNIAVDWQEPMTLELGYSLTVTPSVGADFSSINLVLRPEISSLIGWEEFPVVMYGDAKDSENVPKARLPNVARQYIETEAVVRSGETIVLGGLVDNSKDEAESGTPWISHVPFLGYLFKTQEKTKTNKNLLIFVTATLISDAGEDLIPLNPSERYGLSLPADAKTPNVLKSGANIPPPPAKPALVPDAPSSAREKAHLRKEAAKNKMIPATAPRKKPVEKPAVQRPIEPILKQDAAPAAKK